LEAALEAMKDPGDEESEDNDDDDPVVKK